MNVNPKAMQSYGKIANTETDPIRQIVMLYDGAVVVYEWQDSAGVGDEGHFNHKFTLKRPPRPNPHKLKKGVIKIIEYQNATR